MVLIKPERQLDLTPTQCERVITTTPRKCRPQSIQSPLCYITRISQLKNATGIFYRRKQAGFDRHDNSSASHKANWASHQINIPRQLLLVLCKLLLQQTIWLKESASPPLPSSSLSYVAPVHFLDETLRPSQDWLVETWLYPAWPLSRLNVQFKKGLSWYPARSSPLIIDLYPLL